MKKLFSICLFVPFSFFFLLVSYLIDEERFLFSFLRWRVLYFYKIIIKHIIRSISSFFHCVNTSSFEVYDDDLSELSFVSILVTSNVWMNEKGGSRTHLSLIALHDKLRKQMSNIVALLFYRSCVRYADTPPMLVSLRVFLLLPSVVHRHSSIFFVIRVVVFYLLLYVNIEFLLRQKKKE